jgi:hypothetical protein
MGIKENYVSFNTTKEGLYFTELLSLLSGVTKGRKIGFG